MDHDEYDPADDLNPASLAGGNPDVIARGYAAGTRAALAAMQAQEDREVAAYERPLARAERTRR